MKLRQMGRYVLGFSRDMDADHAVAGQEYGNEFCRWPGTAALERITVD
jgi:hypothetical protein